MSRKRARYTGPCHGRLNNLGNSVSELGRRKEALEAALEAAEIRWGLSKMRPEAFSQTSPGA